jgi:hypothetical protein
MFDNLEASDLWNEHNSLEAYANYLAVIAY